jgi:hypothetical protein
VVGIYLSGVVDVWTVVVYVKDIVVVDILLLRIVHVRTIVQSGNDAIVIRISRKHLQ